MGIGGNRLPSQTPFVGFLRGGVQGEGATGEP